MMYDVFSNQYGRRLYVIMAITSHTYFTPDRQTDTAD